MKIKINENEDYNIKLPETISGQELFEIVDRLQHITKIVGKDPMSIISQASAQIKPKKSYNLTGNSKLWNKDRKETLKLIKLHYTASLDEKRAYAKEHNIAWEVLCSRIWGLRKKWNVKPKEVGLKTFMPRGHFQPKRKSVVHKTRTSRPFTKSRELALQIVHTHYWGTDEQKQAIATQYNIEWEKLMRSVTYLTQKWKMTPQEVGLKAFPNKQTFGDFRKDKEKWRII